jgi:hypothetical protein
MSVERDGGADVAGYVFGGRAAWRMRGFGCGPGVLYGVIGLTCAVIVGEKVPCPIYPQTTDHDLSRSSEETDERRRSTGRRPGNYAVSDGGGGAGSGGGAGGDDGGRI